MPFFCLEERSLQGTIIAAFCVKTGASRMETGAKDQMCWGQLAVGWLQPSARVLALTECNRESTAGVHTLLWPTSLSADVLSWGNTRGCAELAVQLSVTRGIVLSYPCMQYPVPKRDSSGMCLGWKRPVEVAGKKLWCCCEERGQTGQVGQQEIVAQMGRGSFCLWHLQFSCWTTTGAADKRWPK